MFCILSITAYLCSVILNNSVMKTIEELKNEQYEAKAKLHELVEFINSEEYYSLTQSEKNIIGQRRIALEMYLNSLTKGIYDREGSTFDTSSTLWPLLMSSLFSGLGGLGSSSAVSDLKKQLEEDDFKTGEEEVHDEQIYAVPV